MDEEGKKRLLRLERRLEVLAAEVLLVDDVSAEVSQAFARLVLLALDVDACCGRVGLGNPALAEERLTFASTLVALLLLGA